jgi:hypothetical protein
VPQQIQQEPVKYTELVKDQEPSKPSAIILEDKSDYININVVSDQRQVVQSSPSMF